jgi:hypothetical protein
MVPHLNFIDMIFTNVNDNVYIYKYKAHFLVFYLFLFFILASIHRRMAIGESSQ